MKDNKLKANNFECPKCACYTTIKDSKLRASLGGRLRYRECLNCGHVFKTMQKPGVPEVIYNGVRRASVRFTPKDIKQIRQLYAEGRTSGQLAMRYQCSATSIFRVVHHKVHQHVA